MPQKSRTRTATVVIGIDIGKNSFHVVGLLPTRQNRSGAGRFT